MPRDTVSVVIVNHRATHLLPRCLAAVAGQTRPPDAVIVVDNPGTGEDIRDLLAAVPGGLLPDRATVLSLADNVGFAAANNLAIRSCDTEFVALLNPDAFPHPEWLERLLTAAERHPEAAAFGSRQMIDGQPDLIDGIGDVYHASGVCWRRSHGCRLTPADLLPREIFSPCAAAALYRRTAVLEVGGFDEDFFCYVEDVDLGFRLRLAGHRAISVPDAVVDHVGGASSGGRTSEFATYQGHRNLVWCFAKNMPLPLVVALAPLHLAQTLVSLVRCGARGEVRAFLRAKRDALLGLPAMLRKRCDIQRRRRASTGAVWRALDKGCGPS